MRRRTLIIAMLIALLSMIQYVYPVMATTVQISHSSATQPSGSNWCWAACDMSIIDQYESTCPWLATIVHWVHFGVEEHNPSNNCPFDAPSSRTATLSETRSALTHWGVTTSVQSNSLTWNGIRSQINNDHLVLCAFSHSPVGHAVMACGWTDALLYGDSVYYMDPSDGNCHRTSWTNYSNGSFLGSGYSWFGTIFDCQ